MPLVPGNSRSAIGKNIHELSVNGSRPRSHDQIVAIALANADRHPRASGGRTPLANGGPAAIDRALKSANRAARQRLAEGGMPEIPYFERQEARDIGQAHPGGLVTSAVPGRTDMHNVNVLGGSYVLPADVVSGLGEGNTFAGAKVTDEMLNTGPWGIRNPQIRHGSGYGAIPRPPAPFRDEAPSAVRPPVAQEAARGGKTGSVPIVVAGGEYIVLPDQVARIGGGDIKRGHSVLDAFVRHVRKKTVKTLRTLPGPVK